MDISKTLSIKCRLIMLAMVALFSIRAMGQSSVDARQIMDDIREQKAIAYKNVTVKGDLDFTYMNEKIQDLPVRKKWWRNNGTNTVEESISTPIVFEGCTFEDDVLAYIHDEPSGYTFVANFDKKVIFKNCTFERKAMFKYSDFDEEVSFSGSSFQRMTSFKYAEFDERADFSDTSFEEDATFKYAQFDRGGSFDNSRFDESWNIKYMNARGDFSLRGVEVRDDIDSKYTKINGKSFSSYLLSSRD